MIKFSGQRGYTLVETLVALTLLLLFLFLVNDLVPILLLKSGNNLKLQAITEAKNQMEETLLLQNYSDITKELEKGLLLKQNTELINDQILITITVSIKRNNKILYSLKSYAQKINEYQISVINKSLK